VLVAVLEVLATLLCRASMGLNDLAGKLEPSLEPDEWCETE